MTFIFIILLRINEKLNPNRIPKEPFGLKAESSLNRIILNPSNANLEETLYINIPKLSKNVVIIPGSIYVRFDLNIGHAKNTVVNNVGRSLITRMKITFGGEIIQDLHRYELLKIYENRYVPTEERADRLKYGVSSLNTRKLRTNAGDKSTSDASEVLAAIHNKNYYIQLDHTILTDYGVILSLEPE